MSGSSNPTAPVNAVSVALRAVFALACPFDRERRALDGGHYLHSGSDAAKIGPGLGDDTIKPIVIAGWIVVREASPLDPCRATQGQRVLNGAVPPANLLRILLSSVLRVMDDEVSMREKFAMTQVFAEDLAYSVCKMPGMRFVIGCVYDRCTLRFEPVAKRQRWVIQVTCPNRDVCDLKGAFYKLMVSDSRAEVVQLDWEVGILHLAFEGIPQRSVHSFGCIKVPLILWREERREEWDTLDVVPMRMAEQYVSPERLAMRSEQILAELPYAGSAVYNDERAIA